MKFKSFSGEKEKERKENPETFFIRFLPGIEKPMQQFYPFDGKEEERETFFCEEMSNPGANLVTILTSGIEVLLCKFPGKFVKVLLFSRLLIFIFLKGFASFPEREAMIHVSPMINIFFQIIITTFN